MAPAHAVAIAGALLASLSVLHGVLFAAQFPDRAHLSTGYRGLHAPALYDVVDELPADVTVLTNYPQGLWWQTRREPTLFAFTRPRPGNSHVPLTLDETVEQICARTTYLAWFAGLRNAGEGPAERRPEIVEVVDLITEHTVPGGVLYRLELRPMPMATHAVDGDLWWTVVPREALATRRQRREEEAKRTTSPPSDVSERRMAIRGATSIPAARSAARMAASSGPCSTSARGTKP